jgi:hypothetical protein
MDCLYINISLHGIRSQKTIILVVSFVVLGCFDEIKSYSEGSRVKSLPGDRLGLAEYAPGFPRPILDQLGKI